jgi:hypothetical protein
MWEVYNGTIAVLPVGPLFYIGYLDVVTVAHECENSLGQATYAPPRCYEYFP